MTQPRTSKIERERIEHARFRGKSPREFSFTLQDKKDAATQIVECGWDSAAFFLFENPRQRADARGDVIGASRFALQHEARVLGLDLYEIEVVPSDGSPIIEGYAISGITEEDAVRVGHWLGHQFVVFWKRGRQPRLLRPCLEPISEKDLKLILWDRVSACLHGIECTTGCPQMAANYLLAVGVKRDACEKILDMWEDRPPAFPAHENFMIEFGRKNIDYKKYVVSKLRDSR